MPDITRDQYIEHVTNVAAFLGYLRQEQPGVTWGGRKIDDVIDSFQVLAGLPENGVQRLVELD